MTFPQATARRRRIKITPLRIMIAAALLILIVGGSAFAFNRHWAPSRARYPVQGATLSAASGEIIWRQAKANGVDFVYLLATSGATGRDPAFAANLDGSRGVGLPYGAVHRYSLCAGATAQATDFIATVPRDPAMLPPTVDIAFTPDCPNRPSRDKLLAELADFLNQIEAHSGKPAILRVSREVEAAYALSSAVNRTLWLSGTLFPPGYATRPWVMWTASTDRRIPGIDGPIEWDVVRP